MGDEGEGGGLNLNRNKSIKKKKPDTSYPPKAQEQFLNPLNDKPRVVFFFQNVWRFQDMVASFIYYFC